MTHIGTASAIFALLLPLPTVGVLTNSSEQSREEARVVEALAAFKNARIECDPGGPVVAVSFTYASKKAAPHELVTDATLKELAALTHLKSLTLEFTQVTDTGLKELAALKQLRSLSIHATPVTDAGMKELLALKQLRALQLHGTRVTEAGLKELTALKDLEVLGLGEAMVTAAGCGSWRR
jgi:hypothetical protein